MLNNTKTTGFADPLYFQALERIDEVDPSDGLSTELSSSSSPTVSSAVTMDQTVTPCEKQQHQQAPRLKNHNQ